MNKIRKKIFLFCLLCIFVLTGLTACGGEEGIAVNSANALARKLASDSAVKINVSKDILLEKPIVVNGEKEIVGNGKIVAAIEDGEEKYMITVANGGKLTIGGSVKVDASGLMGGIHVQDGGAAAVSEKAVVMNASEVTANALIEGSFEVKGGTLKDAKGHNIYNKKETVISGGEIIGSGEKYAGIYNEGTLSQTGGSVSKAYNNISNMKGSTFTFEGGTNTKSIRDGVFVAEGATLKATKKDAVIEEAGARGILLHGKADIKVITVKGCGDTLIKVGKRGVLNLGNGILQEGNYHGVDNAGTMMMMGGNIQMNRNCGIVNTGTLKVTGGTIANNENKGILNKHEGKADVTSAMVNFTSNKTAIANEDKAVFEFAKAKILMSTQTNIYCYDGTINIHDISLNASTSNNVRVINGVINMTNVEVKGNSQKSNASHHGIIMDGGTINAENVTVSMTTGCGMRVKGGVFKGKNIKMHDINRTAISMSKHDYLDMEGLVEINGLEIQSTNYNNVLNEGGGTIKITNAKLAVAGSNSVRTDGGRVELTNVTIPGHKEGSKDNIHGIYMEGGEIVAKNVTVNNTSGNALRNKNGKFVGTNIKLSNIKGQSAIWNLPLNDEEKDGIIEIDGLTIKNSFSKNITLDSGVTTIKNATLGATGGNNIKVQNNDATLYIYNTKIEGQHAEATASTHGIMVEGGNVFGENIEIYNTNANAVRCKLGQVDLKNVKMHDLGQAGISNGTMVKDDVELGVGHVKIDGLTITNAGTNDIQMDAGTVEITNAVLGKVETVNHNTKVTNTGVLTMKNVEVQGNASANRHAIIAEKGGKAFLTDVVIKDAPGNAIHINHEDCKVVGENVTIKDSCNGAFSSAGTIEIKNLTTENLTNNNILTRQKGNVIVTDSKLGPSKGHNVKAEKGSSVSMTNTIVEGVAKDAPGDKRAIMAEGGAVTLDTVTIVDGKNGAIFANKAESEVVGKDVVIKDSGSAVHASLGVITIDGLTTENIKNNNVFSGDDQAKKKEEQSVVTIKNAVFGQTTSGHNVKSSMNGNVVLENVQVNGTNANDKYGVIIEKGSSMTLTNVTIKDVLGTKGEGMCAVYSNHADNEVTGKDVTIENCRVGIRASAGSVKVEGLTTKDVVTKNIHLPEGATATVNVTGGSLGQTEAHNVHVKGADGLVTLTDVTINASTSNYAIITENGGDATLTDVTITAAKANAIHVNHTDSKVQGNNVTITNANNAVCTSNGTIIIDNLVTSGIKNNNALSDGGAITIKNSEITASTAHNMKTTAGTITLNHVKLLGTTANDRDVLMAEGGTFVLKDVEITDAKRHAIYSNKETSKVIGEKVTITGTAANNVLVTAGEVKLMDSSLGRTTGGHNIKTTGGTILLENTEVLGTSSGSHHVIMAEGGDINLDNVEISGTTAAADRAAIRINNAASKITGQDVTITDCTYGISGDNGQVDINGLTVDAEVHNIYVTGSNVLTVKNATFAETTGHNINILGGTVTLKDVDVTKGQIYTTKEFSIGGVIKATIFNDGEITLKATSSLEGSAIVMDWPADKVKIDFVGMDFENVEDAKASRKVVSLGNNTKTVYALSFYGKQMVLKDINNVPYTVTNFDELKTAVEEINTSETINTATITVAGNITVTELVTIKAGKTVCIQDDTTVRTIKRGADYHGGLLQVDVSAALTLGSSTNDNKNITLIIDGGSKDGIKNTGGCSLVANNGSLTVASGVKLANNFSSGNNRGLGIYAAAGSTTEFSGILENIVGTGSSATAATNGSAIVVNGATLNLTDAIIKDNATKGFGVIQITGVASMTATNTKFEGNKAAGSGGAIFVQGADATFSAENCEFTSNEATGHGGAITIEQATEGAVVIRNTKFKNNKTDGEGSSINVPTGCMITLENCQFTGGTTSTSTENSSCGYGDVRVANNTSAGGVKISGEMVVDIYLNQAGTLDVVGALAEDSNVVANWRKGKITGESFEGINYASADVMNASKGYIALSENYSNTYVIKNADAKGTLVKPIEVKNETALKDAITAIGGTSDKIGFIKVKENFTLSGTINIPEGVNVTILDDGTARTITRAKKDISLFEVKSGASLSFISTSKDNANPTLTIDGGSAEITNSNGAALIGVSGHVNVGKGVVLANNKSTGNNQGFAIYSNAGSTTVFSGVVGNIVGTNASVKGNVFVIKGDFTLKDAIVRDNEAVAGGVIRIQGGRLTAIDTVFENNSSEGNGGVILADTTGSTLRLESCIFKENSTTGNGGAIHNFIANTEIINCKFENNTAGKNGGAIYSGNGVTLTITGDGTNKSVFTNNKANGAKTKASDDETYYGGGAICIGSGNMTVSGYKFTENETKADGGAINNRGNNLTVNNCEFTSNKALKQNGIDGYGGAIFMFQGTLNMDVNATTVTRFEKNEATYGGAVYQKAGSITIHNAVFDENKGGWNGGAIYHKKEVTLKDCHFTANTTISKGGALANEGGTLVATNCEFIGNISDDEGGAYRQASSGKGTFTMCTFNNNTAKNTGGGAIKFNTGSLMIDDCTFTGNKATKGDANGHDIRLSTTTTKPTIKNSTFKKSNVRDSEGTAGAYTDGGNNTLVTE